MWPTRFLSFIKALVLLYYFLFSVQTTMAQENDSIVDHSVTKQFWLNFYPSWRINESIRLNTQFQYRTVSPRSWSRFNTRAEIDINLNDFFIKSFRMTHHLVNGIGYYYIDNFNSTNAFEFRIYQGYKLGFNIRKRFNMKHYVRLEERFTNILKDNDNSFGLRMRYRITGIVNLEDLFISGEQGFYIPIDLEFFFNLKKSKQFNDVLRFSPGLGYLFDPLFKIQLSLTYQYSSQDFDNLVRTNDIIFLLKVYKTFNLSKEKNDKTQ